MSTLYLRAARLLTGVDNGVIEDAAVQVEDGRIVAVGPAAQVRPPDDPAIPQVDYGDATLLPGLIDAHVHLTLRRGLDTPLPAVPVTDGRALLQGVQAARGVLAAGVTTGRDCAARGHHAQELRDAVEGRIIAGPRILASGPPITTTAGHIWRLGYEADSVTEVRRAVRRLVKEGVDFIKVCATGGARYSRQRHRSSAVFHRRATRHRRGRASLRAARRHPRAGHRRHPASGRGRDRHHRALRLVGPGR